MTEFTPDQRAEIEALKQRLCGELKAKIERDTKRQISPEEHAYRLQYGLIPEEGLRAQVEIKGEMKTGTLHMYSPPRFEGGSIVSELAFVPDMEINAVINVVTGESQMTVTGTAEQLEGFNASDNSI